MRQSKTFICCVLAMVFISNSHAQGILKKIKNAANTVMDKSATNGQGGTNNTTPGNSNNSNSNNPANRGGQGLISTPPDVKENLTSAETAFKAGNYSEARYSVQQAMLGVELEIGQSILKSLPEAVVGLQKEASSDQVTSTGWGWAGLTIQRIYKTGDKKLTLTIANNSVWMQAINLYFTNTGYAQSTGGQQKWKQTKVKGYKAIIEYEESSGYKLSVPLGQSSLLVFEGINFASEQDMMNAANQINIDQIKAKLGEK